MKDIIGNTVWEDLRKIRVKKPGLLVIFTDLDGTLLNHADYSFVDALPALELIKRSNIPLIFCTSKTRSEVEELRGILELDEPFIVENGGGVFFPEEYRGFDIPESKARNGYRRIMLGAPYPLARIVVEHVRQHSSLQGFNDMEAEEIAEETGLSVDQAVLAKQREFSEPLLLNDTTRKHDLFTSARAAGLRVIRGGRFHHLIDEHNDKGVAVKLTATIFQRHFSEKILTIGLGDSPNDLPLLRSVDIPVLIPHPDGTYEAFNLSRLIKAPYHGSKGWNAVMLALLPELNRTSIFKS
ncbi:MAG: HAD-IIB family hydrolase [Thermodesulfobacteriota bacterium]